MFNELSIAPVNSKNLVREILENFVQSFIKAREMGFSEMRLYENSIQNLYQIQLFNGYNIDKWLEDNEKNSANEYIVSRDSQASFQEIFTTYPLITESEISENEFYNRSEFTKLLDDNTHKVFGLGAAYIYDSLAISLETNLEWKNNNISILHYFLTHNGEEVNENASVKHFSNINFLNAHESWIQQIQVDSLKKSQELWEQRDVFFPHLTLCAEVERQLQKIGVNKMLLQIINRLKSLNDYAEHWKTGDFSYEDVNATTDLRISPESNNTIKNYGSLRRFTIPNQGKKLFDLHIKTGNLRFHFYPDNNNRKIYIGYIGKHLRTFSEK